MALTYTYGTPDTRGSGKNLLNYPDDAHLLADGKLVTADIRNCRLLFIDPKTSEVVTQWGTPGQCKHNPPHQLAHANGATPMENGDILVTEITDAWLLKVLGERMRRYDKGGEQFYDTISALHKSVRGSDPDAALYWFVRMLDGGADPRYMARRFIRMAAEDVGLADPRALRLALAAAEVYERLGSPEGELALAECVIYLAVAPKSNAVYKAFNAAKAFVKKDGTRPVPMHLRNAPTKLMKELDYGKGYRYAHDEEGGFAAGESYLPEGMAEPGFYQPVDRGLELRIADKLRELKKRNDQKI